MVCYRLVQRFSSRTKVTKRKKKRRGERVKEDTPCLVVGCFMFNISFDGNSL